MEQSSCGDTSWSKERGGRTAIPGPGSWWADDLVVSVPRPRGAGARSMQQRRPDRLFRHGRSAHTSAFRRERDTDATRTSLRNSVTRVLGRVTVR
ncbi:hypothetical protein ACR6C2_24360 [Streptomyces sp. INA 01156]